MKTALGNLSHCLPVLSQFLQKHGSMLHRDFEPKILRKTRKKACCLDRQPPCLPACLHKGMRRPAPESPHVPCISSKLWLVPRQSALPPHHLLCPHPCAASRCSPAPYLHRGYCTHPCPPAPPSPSEYSPVSPPQILHLNADNRVAKQHESSKQPTMADRSNPVQTHSKAYEPGTILPLSISSIQP